MNRAEFRDTSFDGSLSGLRIGHIATDRKKTIGWQPRGLECASIQVDTDDARTGLQSQFAHGQADALRGAGNDDGAIVETNRILHNSSKTL